MSDAQPFTNPTKRQRKPRLTPLAERIPDAHLDALSEIFPSFGAWYRANYDEQGQPLIRSNPGLQQQPDSEQKK